VCCVFGGESVSSGWIVMDGLDGAYMVATIRLGVGLLGNRQSLLSRVLSCVIRKDGIVSARCCCLVVDHHSWRPGMKLAM
jgi:hypothetical protein